jgi:hypothetical protein
MRVCEIIAAVDDLDFVAGLLFPVQIAADFSITVAAT